MYKALYRQYRPKTFSDLVGQEAIAATLQSAIEQEKVAHAYLFSGPRGTGKTSVAKIFARELNGVSKEDSEKDFADIIEIDAASNNGIDDIRNLIEAANYAPLELPYKVYIIDEVHMMTTSAFNALLKTIEEPPAQVKFILATTDPQKIPATILSRVQRFEFKRIPKNQIIERLEFVLNDLNAEFEPEALDSIATIAEGGMRDALSILDQVYSISTDNKITNQQVLDITGRTTPAFQKELLLEALNGNSESALTKLTDQLNNGKEARVLVADLIELIKDALIIDLDPQLVSTNVQAASEISKSFDQNTLTSAVDILAKNLEKMRNSSRPQTFAQIMIIEVAQINNQPKTEVENNIGQIPDEIKATMPQTPSTIDEVVADLKNTEIKTGEIPKSTEIESEISTQPEGKEGAQSDNNLLNYDYVLATKNPDEIVSMLGNAKKEELVSAKEAFEQIKESSDTDFSDIVSGARIVAAGIDYLIVSFEVPEFINLALKDDKFINELGENFTEVMGVDYRFAVVSDIQWDEIKKAFIDRSKGVEHLLDFKTTQSSDVVVEQKNDESQNDVLKLANEMFDSSIIKVEKE